MSDVKQLQDRVTQLEECFAHQEHLVDQLNKVVIELRADIKEMESKNEEQRRHLKALLQHHSIIEEDPNEKPPHY